ncbi:phosphohydrolase [Clostridium sp. TW13]|uniref:Phosphohydrolase n=1 Tax=Inconstantimicrobium mannanitabidum TaxID=1604901 RepID=A0ACB5R8E4_9CLOT|nr:phosphohydrolase [Clostridium sp. TW13]
MNFMVVIMSLIIIFIYIAMWYYVGRNIKKIFQHRKINLKIYWAVFWIMAFAYIISRLVSSILTVNNIVSVIFSFVGAITLSLFIYLLLGFLISDLFRVVFKIIKLNEKYKQKIRSIYGNGLIVLIITAIIVCSGFVVALNPKTTEYKININKAIGNKQSLNIVLVSDVHIGIGVRERGIDKMVDSINKLQPEVVFFAGDVFDESSTTALKEYYSQACKKINSKYGVYAITGNHEYFQNFDESIEYYKKANITVLQDEVVKVNNQFYVVGRKDTASESRTNEKIKSLDILLRNIDRNLPIIVLNHKPEDLKSAENEKVDLQLSGHTHNGQIFPGNIIIKKVFEDPYGYLKKNDFNLVVTSGYGTWGPPIRIGTQGEIVNIKMYGNK